MSIISSNMKVHRGGIADVILSFPTKINKNLKGGDRRPGGASTPWAWTWALPTSPHAGGDDDDGEEEHDDVVAGGSGQRRE